MAIIKKIPWKALIILVIGLVVGMGMGIKYGHNITWLTAEKTLESSGVSKKVNEPNIKNEIKNEIDIGKVKKSDSIVIKMEPFNNQEPVNIISKSGCGKDSICIAVEHLTKRQKRRLGIDF